MANKIKQSDNYDIYQKEEITRITDMIKNFKKDKNIELEISFRNINYSNYMRITGYYVDLVDEKDISAQNSLDISITLQDGNTYRVSILDADKINLFIQKNSKATMPEMQKYLLSLNPSDEYQIMYKDRGGADRLFIEDYAMVFKTTRETPLTKETGKPKLNGTEKMLFRYKERVSFVVSDYVRIDVTNVKESPHIWNLANKPSNYEIEIEVINDKITSDILLNEVYSVLMVTQDSDIPIGKKEALNVIKSYQNLLGIKSGSHLDSRNVISIEAQHIVKFIPNRYAVTDKADGDRYFLISIKEGIYLLSTNLTVKKINLQVKNKKFYDMILDGELIKNENGIMFLVFELIYALGIDYRFNDKYTLTNRITSISQIMDEGFGTLIPFNDYTDKFSDLELDKIKTFYTSELKSYWKSFRKALANTKSTKTKKDIFITRKVYFIPYGIDSSEVFMYADMLWKFLVYDGLAPYKLDGIIYTPINSPYMIKVSQDNLDSVPLEYKWKVPMQNSIDFYVKFEKDIKGDEAIFYDTTVVRGEGKPYKICNLYVGVTRGGEEKPIQFKAAGVEQKANIYLVDGAARDVEGNVISDETVVEFIFDNTKVDIYDAYKWIPLRTRYDKTESVQKYGKRYGNNLSIAVRIWKTIINPITEENIASLGNPLTHQKEIDRLSKSMETYNKQSFTYYQKKTANASGMRAFNNWIKSNMILTYCKNKNNVLDIGCGRGGDLIKFIHAGIKEYVGVDIDNNGLYVINDSAFNRYKTLKSTNKNVPPMYFINADARGLFTVNVQEKILPNMPDSNKKLINTFLSGNKKYDVINCQFTLHYYLSDKLSWSNFCENLNNHMEHHSYFLVTCFDGKLIYDRLMGKQKMTVSYTDNQGKKSVFYEIVKIYNDDDPNVIDPSSTDYGIGIPIDFYNSLISNPGTYIQEYLVFPDFLEKSLKERCGLELIESDSFFNLFNLYKNYFIQEQSGEFALADTSHKRYTEIRQFDLSLFPNSHSDVVPDAALASFKLSMLNRYYIFKKTQKINNISEPSRIVGINHEINLGKVLTPYFDDNKMIIDMDRKNVNVNKIYQGIRKAYINTKPSVYLIKHSIKEDGLDSNEIYRKNKLEFSKIKDGTDPKTLLIYKSPEKIYYPIYYQDLKYNDITDDFLSQNRVPIEKIRKTYLLDSNKIINDLDVLVALSKKM